MTQPAVFGDGLSYTDAAASFQADDVERLLSGSFATGINACVECCDRHADTGRVALDWIGADGCHERYTFSDMKARSAQVANLLTELGVKPGDVVAGLLPRIPELIATILGVWRAGAVYQPLFTAFGPKAIEHRIGMSNAKLVVTDAANRARLDDVADLPKVAVIVGEDQTVRPADVDFRSAVDRQPAAFEPVMRRGDDLLLMMSTSGTTGLAKGVPVPIRALAAFATYMHFAIDLRPEDVFWNIADPGWAYGLYYAVTGPLLLGHATTLCEAPFTVEGTYDIVEKFGVTNFAGAPTAYRMLIAAGPEAAARIKGRLRVVSSAGEPLNPEVIRWFDQHMDAPIFDHYGQTETGMIVNNHHRLPYRLRPGSAGFPMPGFKVAVLDDEGNEVAAHQPGTLCVDLGNSPMMFFSGYWQQETGSIRNGYYWTGDTVEMDEEGCVTFVGRNDDVITSSGYRIGPFDVESALIEHPAVVETAVVGVPDPERTELVKAFVVLSNGYDGTNELAEELRLHVRNRLSAHAYPRLIEFVDKLPKTPSGKIQRFLLRKQHTDNQTAPQS